MKPRVSILFETDSGGTDSEGASDPKRSGNGVGDWETADSAPTDIALEEVPLAVRMSVAAGGQCVSLAPSMLTMPGSASGLTLCTSCRSPRSVGRETGFCSPAGRAILVGAEFRRCIAHAVPANLKTSRSECVRLIREVRSNDVSSLKQKLCALGVARLGVKESISLNVRVDCWERRDSEMSF